MYKSLLFLTLPISSLLATAPQWSLDNKSEGWSSSFFVQKYFHNSEAQRQWAWELLGKHKFQGNEHVLDFGCGDGKITAELARILAQGKVTGVDISEKMVEFAHVKFPAGNFKNLEFKALNTLDASDLKEEGKYDVACSFCVLHLVSDPTTTLKNVNKSLKKGGTLLLVVPAGRNQTLFTAAEQTFPLYNMEAPWKKTAPPKVSMRTQEGCKQILEDAGFKVQTIVMNDSPTPYYDKEELVQWMVGNTSANWKIPADIAPRFFSDLVDKMCEIEPGIRNEQGHILFKLSRLEIEATAQ